MEDQSLLNMLSKYAKDSGHTDKSLAPLHIYMMMKQDLLKRKIQQVLHQEYELNTIDDPLIKSVRLMEQRNRVRLKELNAEKHQNSFLWVTINPKQSVKLCDFVKQVAKIAKYSCFIGYCYVYEQRGTLGEKNIGKGFHAHLLLQRNLAYKPSKCKQKVQRGCAKLVGNINNNNQLNFAIIGRDFAVDKYKYISAAKKISKQDKQIGDKQFRKQNNLEIIYRNNISLDIINGKGKKKDVSVNQKNGEGGQNALKGDNPPSC